MRKMVNEQIDTSNFKIWLNENKNYSSKVVSNIVSRLKRADSILPLYNDPVYFFQLEQNDDFDAIKISVKSQIKKAIKLYFEFLNDENHSAFPTKEFNVLSLFANIGVAEAYLEKIGVNVVLANELLERRAILYSKIYPNTHMICGDITNDSIFNSIITESKNKHVNVIMATPPCQGMSTAGQQLRNDERNLLIKKVIEATKIINPDYVFIENVPLFYRTSIDVGGKEFLIPEYISEELGKEYTINKYIINTSDYSVPQTRERAIILLSKKDVKEWKMPEKDQTIVTMRDAIGHLPIVDPFIKDVEKKDLLSIFPHYFERKEQALKISPWHIPPEHIKRQVIVMQHTPSGCTAFDNDKYYPKKENGEPVKGFHNCFARQNWDSPAYTVTMDNRKISSQNNVHPGRLEYINSDGEEIYSDPRALTLYELMIIMSLPSDWPIPKDTSEAFLRRIIGEGIPPLFVKKVFQELINGE